MLAMATRYEQLYFLDKASKKEIIEAGRLLNKYKKIEKIVEDFKVHPPVTDLQKGIYSNATMTKSKLERAVSSIVDLNVRQLIDYRFIKGNKRAATIQRYSGWDYCDKTYDRKITEGIESVAESLRYL
ncbi:hypothetical protein [Paenibacillus sinopodophylli]|uniref:hypothetical protein n=1 Tax=Paenibacillus sinopodophylli TaxID=1837342 RepID=UPI001FECAC64|nr:hypothetical protein [Paenibacillus sinopodophylli]